MAPSRISLKGRHADHGRRADSYRDRHHHVAVGRSQQSPHVDGAAGDPGFGAVGWVDDWKKVVHRDPKGLASRWKYPWTSLHRPRGAAVYLGLTADAAVQLELIVPFFKSVAYPLGRSVSSCSATSS